MNKKEFNNNKKMMNNSKMNNNNKMNKKNNNKKLNLLLSKMVKITQKLPTLKITTIAMGTAKSLNPTTNLLNKSQSLNPNPNNSNNKTPIPNPNKNPTIKSQTKNSIKKIKKSTNKIKINTKIVIDFDFLSIVFLKDIYFF